MKHWKIILVIVLVVVLVAVVGVFFFLQTSSSPAPIQQAVATTTPVKKISQTVTPQTTTAVSVPVTTPPPTTVTYDLTTPDGFAGAFYTQYLSQLAANTGFPYSSKTSTTLDPALTNWLTPNFYKNFETIGNNDDADPVTLAQDDPSTWGSAIQTSIVSTSTTSSVVKVVVGTNQIHTYTVTLKKEASGWRIDSVN